MPLLPCVCVDCRKTYKHLEVARAVVSIPGVCPDCLLAMDDRLFGHKTITVDPQYCQCGRQLVTPRQFVEGMCEHCHIGLCLNPNGVVAHV